MEEITPPKEDRILSCTSKDKTGLNDFHYLPDLYQRDINKVGINRYRIPVKYKHRDGQIMNHDTEVALYIYFLKGKSGINMSRLYQFFSEEMDDVEYLDNNLLKKLLHRYRYDMRDNDTEELIKEAYIDLKFVYPVKQKALKSKKETWQYYQCEINVLQNSQGENKYYLTVCYEYSSTCPCSLSMSKQYESNFYKKEESYGKGIAVAHSQRFASKM